MVNIRSTLFWIFSLSVSFISAQENNSTTSRVPITLSIPSGIDIEISGEVEVEFIDVEGKGGAQHRDEFIQKVDYRSPFVEIDKTVLDFKLLYTDNLTYNFSLRFDDDGAYADKHFLKYQKGKSKLEFGKNRPLIALKRKTEGYPLIGTAYWKGRQYHLDYQKNFSSSSTSEPKTPNEVQTNKSKVVEHQTNIQQLFFSNKPFLRQFIGECV